MRDCHKSLAGNMLSATAILHPLLHHALLGRFGLRLTRRPRSAIHAARIDQAYFGDYRRGQSGLLYFRVDTLAWTANTHALAASRRPPAHEVPRRRYQTLSTRMADVRRYITVITTVAAAGLPEYSACVLAWSVQRRQPPGTEVSEIKLRLTACHMHEGRMCGLVCAGGDLRLFLSS